MAQQVINDIRYLDDVLTGSRKVLLVCDSSFPYLTIKGEIEAMKMPYVVFDQFTPNPLYEDVCKGVELFQSEQCDTILAVGGGSTIDVAKCIKLYCRMSTDKLYLEQEYKDTGVKLIAVPTTAGTGSESTRYAVIYYDGKKQSVTHDSIVPNVAILESKVLKTLPLYQKKCTMLDALCQGIESWWSVNSTDESKGYSKIAVDTIMKWWREYIFDNTEESASYIMEAANYAGRAISITQTTAPHAFSYKITSLYGLPHGHAVAVCLPVIWDFMQNHLDLCIDPRGKDYLNQMFYQISISMGESSPALAIQHFYRMMVDLEIHNPSAINKVQELDFLSSSVNPVRLKNNPVELSPCVIHSLYSVVLR